MIKIENVEVMGWEAAIRGCRNPMNSWDKSDSEPGEPDMFENCANCTLGEYFVGKNDLVLMKKLSKAGTDHSKFLRFITVTADITAPLYWWKEYDTYKVGTVANSCSTMHKIHDKEFTIQDFSYEHLEWRDEFFEWGNILPLRNLENTVICLNQCRKKYLETKNKMWWWQMIQLLPSSYNQKRTVLLNYQVLKNMYHARKNHKLFCWHDFCRWCEELPYFKEVCLDD